MRSAIWAAVQPLCPALRRASRIWCSVASTLAPILALQVSANPQTGYTGSLTSSQYAIPEFGAARPPYVWVRSTEPTLSLQNGSGMDLDMSPIALDYLAEHPYLALVVLHIPIVVALAAGAVHYVRQQREERRLWDPAVVYPYVDG